MIAAEILGLVVLAQFVVILVLLVMNHRARVDTIRSIDRLLILGKSSSPGEAVHAYEKLDRIERARGEIAAQLKRERVKGAQAGGEEVARKPPGGRNWFGYRRSRTEPPVNGG